MLRYVRRLLLCAAPILSACDAPSGPVALLAHDRGISREDREILDEAKRRKAELQEVRSTPAKYVTMAGGWTNYDKGIINDYSDVTEIVVHNASSFEVSDIEGEFTFRSKSDKVLAKVPVKLIGELRAGETKRLKTVGRTIEGSAAQGTLEVTSVLVHE
jgi:hypothetical protein